jgi:hypothetical protein
MRFLKNDMEVDLLPKMPVQMKFPPEMVTEIRTRVTQLHGMLAMVPRHITPEDVKRGAPTDPKGIMDMSAKLAIDAARDTLQAALRNYTAAWKAHEVMTAGKDTTSA